MAYVIGSDAGKKKAEDMKVGQKWKNEKDGSTWEKKSDGTIRVVSAAGNVTENAYKATTPTTSGGSGGGSNKTGGSGGTKQYSQYTGVGSYNDAGISKRDQEKIDMLGDMYNTAKANGDVSGMEDAHAAAEAIRKQYGYSGGVDGSDYIELPIENSLMWNNNYALNNERPTYTSKYDPQINALLKEILNRDSFSYDATKDPLFKQYQQMYMREGDRAMKETMAEAAAGAGGMNSYAITAGQQAQNYYGAQLGDKIPELYQLAYDMYLTDIEGKVRDLGLLERMDDNQYGRFRDTMSDYRDDRNFAYGLYRDDVAQGNYKDELSYNVGQDAIKNDRYDTETAREDILRLVEASQTVPADLIEKSGWTQEYVDLLIAAKQAEEVGKGRNDVDGGGLYNPFGNDDEDDFTEDEIAEATNMSLVQKGMNDLGIPLIYETDVISRLEDAGAIYEADGKLHWNDGWSAYNWELKLESIESNNVLGIYGNLLS